MKSKVVISQNFSHLERLISDILESHSDIGQVIYSARNIVSVIDTPERKIVVKYFKRINLINRFAYTYLRRSKAERAYYNSLAMIERGIKSPNPIAFINCYNGLLLKRSYYICEYTDYAPIKELFARPLCDIIPYLRDFARFAHNQHKEGIYHGDFNVSNTLFKITDSGCSFSMIDSNRMKFGKYSYKKGLFNMRRMNLPVELFGVVAAEYAKEAGVNASEVLKYMSRYRDMFLRRAALKAKFKSYLKNIFNR